MATKKQKEKIVRLIEKWKNKLLLNEWKLVPHYSGIDEDNCAATIYMQPNYFFGKITFNNCFFENDPHTQEEMIVHELCHCITEKAYLAHIDMINYKLVTVDHVNMIREQLTQRIASIAFLRSNTV